VPPKVFTQKGCREPKKVEKHWHNGTSEQQASVNNDHTFGVRRVAVVHTCLTVYFNHKRFSLFGDDQKKN
jgi:hypothetical protein